MNTVVLGGVSVFCGAGFRGWRARAALLFEQFFVGHSLYFGDAGEKLHLASDQDLLALNQAAGYDPVRAHAFGNFHRARGKSAVRIHH